MVNLNDLNAPQRDAVTYNDGPQLVVAGAGSGKTRVLTYKIAYLLELGVRPWNILALTFTNKAADEMKARITQQVQADVRSLQMGTFHSVFARILRSEAGALGFSSNFTIYDETDSRSLVKTVIKELALDTNVYNPSTVSNRISSLKNHLVTAEAYASDGDYYQQDLRKQTPEFGRIYRSYANRCKAANAMDFDDLLLNTFLLFHRNPDVCQKYAARYDYILVDEYQDTNFAQQQIILQLRKDNHRICVVGDDYQSIYGFRGASIDNILSFQRVFPHARMFKLEQNYRSTQHIVAAANSLMKHNVNQIDKNVFSQKAEGARLQLMEAYSDREEAIMICKEIQRLRRQEHLPWEAFAILYRTNAQSRSLEEELRRRAIPHRIYGGTGFYQRKEIKDVMAYFRLLVNFDDEEAFKRIVNFPKRGIGQTTIATLTDLAASRSMSLWRTLLSGEAASQLSRGAQEKLMQFARQMQQLHEAMLTMNAFEFGQLFFETIPLREEFSKGDEVEAESRLNNLDELVNSMEEFVSKMQEEGRTGEVSLENYLQEVSLLTSVDAAELAADGDESTVTLMTIHMAKGLEYPVVFIAGLEENLFPSLKSASTLRELEEERRLLYVAITRAEQRCILSYARNRWQFGQSVSNPASRFLREIDAQHIFRMDGTEPSAPQRGQVFVNRSAYQAPPKPSMPERTHNRWVKLPPSRPLSGAPSAVSAPSPDLRVGEMIEHQRFGIGTVLSVEGEGENTKATVEFRNAGTKQLLLKFARYKKL